MMSYLRLGVNIDHVATLRNARGDVHPDPVRAAKLALAGGADGITVHLREDRRHIRDGDVIALMKSVPAPLNLEMAATEEMLGIALQVKPHAVCIVPERREEVTTEGGLDAAGQHNSLQPIISQLKLAGIRTSLFLDADLDQIAAAVRLGADVVEVHAGAYANAYGSGGQQAQLALIEQAVAAGHDQGLEMHAGHGLTYDNVGPVAAIGMLRELNIGHHMMGEAIFCGMQAAVSRMRRAMDRARTR